MLVEPYPTVKLVIILSLWYVKLSASGRERRERERERERERDGERERGIAAKPKRQKRIFVTIGKFEVASLMKSLVYLLDNSSGN